MTSALGLFLASGFAHLDADERTRVVDSAIARAQAHAEARERAPATTAATTTAAREESGGAGADRAADANTGADPNADPDMPELLDMSSLDPVLDVVQLCALWRGGSTATRSVRWPGELTTIRKYLPVVGSRGA